MASNLENKIDLFIQLVKICKVSNERFNPWSQNDASDFSKKSSNIRCEN